MRFHGNYCGPGWSGGKYQDSVVSDVPAIDEFDRTCKEHDEAYATNGDLLHADLSFAHRNFGKGVRRTAAAIAVGGQAAIRAIDKFIPTVYQVEKKMMLRGSSKNNKAQSGHVSKGISISARDNARGHFQTVSAPAAIGTVLRGNHTVQTKKSKDTIVMETQICIGRPPAATQSAVPEMIGLQYLSPVALGNDEVQNMTRVYQHFRITKASLSFRAVQATNVGGEVIVIADSDPNYRPINTTGGTTFYQRALSTKHSLLTPTWMSEDMDLPVDSRLKVCDNANSTTLEEFTAGVVYIYSDATLSLTGFFLVNLTIEFEGLRFNSRNLISGSLQGLGVRKTLTSGAPTTGADVVLTGSGFTTGDIYALQVSATNVSFNIGTASTLWVLSSGSGTIPYVIGGSSLIYARASSDTTLTIYSTYDSAVGGDTSDKFLYGVTGATGTTLALSVLTQLRNSTQPTL